MRSLTIPGPSRRRSRSIVRARFIVARCLPSDDRRLAEQRGPHLRIADVDVAGGLDAQRKAALDRGSLTQGPEPALQMRELLDVLPLQLPTAHPADARHVGDRIFAGEEFVLAQA